DSSVRWMPPTLGGKSFVTTRVLGISTRRISFQVGGPRGRISRSQAHRNARGGAGTGSTQLDALENGNAFAELPAWRVIAVRGDDAAAWLHDLITADVEGLS